MNEIYFILLAVFGLLVYAFAPAKLSEVGRIIFFCAFLALCMQGAPHFIHAGR